MTKSARVSLDAVRKFSDSVGAVRDYSEKISVCVLCVNNFSKCVLDKIDTLRQDIAKLKDISYKLSDKINDIEIELSQLTYQINDLKNKLSSLEDELSSTPKTISKTDENNNKYDVMNPEYISILDDIHDLRSNILTLQNDYIKNQEELQRINNLDNRIKFQIEKLNGIVSSLTDKNKYCKRTIEKLNDIKRTNFEKSTLAFENLKKIESLITKYINCKIIFDADSNNIFDNMNFDLNTNIFKKHSINPMSDDIYSKELSEEYNDELINDNDTYSENIYENKIKDEIIKSHDIKINEYGHIYEIDGRRYGCKYNSYEDCLKIIPAENSKFGTYEGKRGESKFIPFDYTEEGANVKSILKKYSLDGIEYRNCEPDFEECSEAVIEIDNMTENRYDYYNSDGVLMYGNFKQADLKLAKLWCSENKNGKSDWTARDVASYRKNNNLTWHEKCDTITMVLVRSEINAYFKHIGGVSECRMRDSNNNGGYFDE